MAKIFVSELKKGQAVEGIFLVREKILAKTKSGNPYISLRLGDRSGEIEARIWENALDFLPLFEKDDFVKIQGEADEFQGNLQLRIQRLRKCRDEEIAMEDFLPQTSGEPEKMFADLLEIAATVRHPFLRRLLDAFWADEAFVKKFKMAPAAKAMHHVYIGGLLEHTLAVANLLLLIGPRYRCVNMDCLLTGGILHDVGKIDELRYERAFDYTDPGRLLGHIILTVEMINQKIKSIPDFPEAEAVQMKHLVLSHHGEYVYGSPKRPKTLEALILHHVDDLDAKVNSFLAWIEKDKDDSSRWTSFHRLLDRFIFKPEETQIRE